ncbi:MAG TPA: hypothetical protein VKP64_10165 [Mycobacteriales bacterium]|nr:hypothetical protein [Mycobacteriales bacterium]
MTSLTRELADKRPFAWPLVARRWRWSWEAVAFTVVLLLQFVPLVVLPAVVTVDGPAHVAGGWLLSHLDEPAVRAAYEVNAFPYPNLLTELLLAILTAALPLVAAEKVLVAGWFLLLPLALRYALGGVNPRARWLAVLAFPLATNYLYYYGFYNFCYGLGLFLVVLGFVLRRHPHWTPRSTAVLGGLLLATYLAHLLPFLEALLVLAVVALVGLVRERRAALRSSAALAVAALPSVLLAVGFATRTDTPAAPSWSDPLDLAVGLLTLTRPLLVYDAREAFAATLVAVVLIVLAVLAWPAGLPRATGTMSTVLGVATAACLVTYLAAPARLSADYGFLNDRLVFFPVLVGVLWLGTRTFPARVRAGATAAVLVAAVTLVALRLPTELRYQRHVAELESAATAVPAGSTVLAVRLTLDAPVNGPIRNIYRDPIRHVASRIAAQHHGVNVGHYEAAYDYFPLRFRPDADVWRAIDPDRRGLERVPPRIDLSVPAARRITVVLLIGRRTATRTTMTAPETTRLLGDLARGYRRTEVTRPTGLVEVYQRR